MANITIKHLLDGIAEILQDTDYEGWTESYLVDCYNLEVRYIASKNPDACTKTEAVKLAASVKHSIPSDGNGLISVLMNMGTTGTVYGDAIRKGDIAVIGLYDKDWSHATASATILEFIPDPVDPAVFYTYPPADGTSYVLEEYSIVPDQIVYDKDGDWETAIVGIKERYLEKLEKRILARCYKTDTDIPGNLEREAVNKQEGQE